MQLRGEQECDGVEKQTPLERVELLFGVKRHVEVQKRNET
jgi:hypothetical protein